MGLVLHCTAHTARRAVPADNTSRRRPPPPCPISSVLDEAAECRDGPPGAGRQDDEQAAAAGEAPGEIDDCRLAAVNQCWDHQTERGKISFGQTVQHKGMICTIVIVLYFHQVFNPVQYWVGVFIPPTSL